MYRNMTSIIPSTNSQLGANSSSPESQKKTFLQSPSVRQFTPIEQPPHPKNPSKLTWETPYFPKHKPQNPSFYKRLIFIPEEQPKKGPSELTWKPVLFPNSQPQTTPSHKGSPFASEERTPHTGKRVDQAWKNTYPHPAKQNLHDKTIPLQDTRSVQLPGFAELTKGMDLAL